MSGVWSRIEAFCTGPGALNRVFILWLIALAWTVLLQCAGVMPLKEALSEALAGLRSGAMAAPEGCDAAALAAQAEPGAFFDARLREYGVEEARGLLCLASAGEGLGRAVYLDRVFPLDMVYPLLYGPAVAALVLFSLSRAFPDWRHRLGMRPLRRLVTVWPLFGSVADLFENFMVRALLRAGPAQIDPGLVENASALTNLKWAILLGSLALAAALLVSWAARSALRPRS